MVTGNKTRRYMAEKIALSAIFVISLSAAWVVVELRMVIRLSEPIELSRSGLSVSMPSGNGWDCTGKWLYDDDGFTLSSVLEVGGETGPSLQPRTGLSSWLGVNRPYAKCRYLLAARKDALQEHIGRLQAEGETIEKGQTAAGELAIEWARIKTGEGPEIYLGVCGLPAGRQLEIEVFQTAGERGLAQKVFERIVKGIRFSDNGLLQAGAKIINEARKTVMSDFVAESQPVYFVIADSRGQAIGFTMDAITVSDADANAAIRAGSYYYVRGPIPDERVGLYWGDGTLERFVWRVEGLSSAGSRGIRMTASEGVLLVRKSGGRGLENEYVLGEAAVPDIVIEPVLRRILDEVRTPVVIDLIRPDGIISPMYVEKMELAGQQAVSASLLQEDGNSLRVEILDGRGFWQQICFDSSKEPIKKVLSQEGTYILNRADANQIEKLFPERADFIRDKGRFINREEF